MITTVPLLDATTLLDVYSHLNLMFLLTDETFVIQSASPVLESLLGCDLEGRELSEAIPALAGIDQEFSQIAFHKAEPWRIRGLQLAQSSDSQYDMLIMPRSDKPGLILAAWLIDIQSSVEQALRQQRNELTLSLDKLVEQASVLRTANDRLASLDRERRALLNLIARDISSSVSVIAGYVDLLSEQLELPAGSGGEKALSEIRGSALHLTDLVKSVLVLESVEHKLTDIDWQQLDLPTLVQTVVAMWRSTAAMRNVQIDVHVEGDSSEIEADVELLQQALQIVVERFLHLAAIGSRLVVRISVWDRWAILRFELSLPKPPLSQRHAHQGGQVDEQMDLQLALVRLITEGHGGHLSFEEDENQGSVLSLWMLRKPDRVSEPQDAPPNEAPPISDILVVGQGTIRIQTTSQQVWVNNVLAPLTASEYQLLLYLAEHVDQVVSHEQIAMAIWSQGESKSLDNLRVLMWRLRQKLSGPGNKVQCLRTVRGFGYILVS